MKYAVEMGSGAITYVPNFMTTVSGFQELICGIHRHTDSLEIAVHP
jgi:hypothetical protein